jgi:hypothetical protein
MKNIIFTIALIIGSIYSNAQIIYEDNFDDNSYAGLNYTSGPNDNPAQANPAYTVTVTGGELHYIIPATAPTGPQMSGFLDLPAPYTPIIGSFNHTFSFPYVSDLMALGSTTQLAIAGCYVRGNLNNWVGGTFGDYWFGFVYVGGNRLSAIRQGSTQLVSEPFTATNSVSYEVRKIGNATLQLWAKYDSGTWHQVGTDVSITLNSATTGANFNTYITHVRVLDISGGAADVRADNYVWYVPSSLSSNNEVFSNKSISIYPNPTTNFITFETQFAIISTSILNHLGQNFNCKIDGDKIDVSNLATGIYFIIFTDQLGKSFTTKFIKN